MMMMMTTHHSRPLKMQNRANSIYAAASWNAPCKYITRTALYQLIMKIIFLLSMPTWPKVIYRRVSGFLIILGEKTNVKQITIPFEDKLFRKSKSPRFHISLTIHVVITTNTVTVQELRSALQPGNKHNLIGLPSFVEVFKQSSSLLLWISPVQGCMGVGAHLEKKPLSLSKEVMTKTNSQ